MNIVKATGMIRRVDDLGRINIPRNIRRSLNIEYGEAFEIFIDDDCIIFKKYNTTFNGKSYGI